MQDHLPKRWQSLTIEQLKADIRPTCARKPPGP
jgi:hypothetical protein